ncbi:hypothetical protein Emed_000973 [Eimeria media]
MASRLGDLIVECQAACDKLGASLDALKAAREEDASVQEALLGACRRDNSECAAALRQLQLHAHLASPEDAAAVQLQHAVNSYPAKEVGSADDGDRGCGETLSSLDRSAAAAAAAAAAAVVVVVAAAAAPDMQAPSRAPLSLDSLQSPDTAGGGQRERLLSLHHKSTDSHAQLERARMLAFETERFGFYVASDLATQRQTIQRARSRAGDVGVSLGQARLSLRRVLRAARRRRWLLSSFGLLVAGTLFYLLVFRALWRLTPSSSKTNDTAAGESDPATAAVASTSSLVKPLASQVPEDFSLQALEQQQQEQQALLLQQEQQQQQQQQPPPLTGRDKFNNLQRAAREKRQQQELQQQQQDQQQQQLQEQQAHQQQLQQQQMQHTSDSLDPSQGQTSEQQAQHLQQPQQQQASLPAAQQAPHEEPAAPRRQQQQQEPVQLQSAQVQPWSDVSPQQEPPQQQQPLPQQQQPLPQQQLSQQQQQPLPQQQLSQQQQQLSQQQQQQLSQQQQQLSQQQLSQQQPPQPALQQPAELQAQSLSPPLQPLQQQLPGQQQTAPNEQTVHQQQQQQQPQELQQVAAAAEGHQMESPTPNN